MRRHSVTKRIRFEANNDMKNPERSLHSEKIPVNHPNSNEIEKHTSGKEKDSMKAVPDDLEIAIEKGKSDIFKHVENMKMQMLNNEEKLVKEIENYTRGGLANIKGGGTPQDEFFIKSLINYFEEIIGNIGKETMTDVNQTMNESRKILHKVTRRIEQNFKPESYTDVVRETRRDIGTYHWIGLWSFVAVLACIYPDFFLKFFGSAVAFYQSTILVFFLFSILCLYSPIFK